MTDFPYVLHQLRKERDLTQREVADALQISQALLSHYENGAREPSYDFLLRAAKYYQVSTDYLLGRTLKRANPNEDLKDGFTIEDPVEDPEKMHIKTLENAQSFAFALLQRLNDPNLTEAAEKYMILAMYRVFRYLYLTSRSESEAIFNVPVERFQEVLDMASKRVELEMKMRALRHDSNGPQLPLQQDLMAGDDADVVRPAMDILRALDEELAKQYRK